MYDESVYCDSLSTWASADDLYARFGDEYVDKLSIRRIWDNTIEQYVADESFEGREKVLNLALCDAKTLLKQKISKCFDGVDLLDENIFPAIKQWHIKLSIETLKVGGDCFACVDCNKSFDEFCEKSSICTDDGICLTAKNTFISVSTPDFVCDKHLKGCKCQG